jgi:hypothetical protein
MVSLMGARRRAERFDAAVEGRGPVEQLPADLRELVDVVATMREVDAPPARPEFAAALREQLMTEAETALVPASPLTLPQRRSGARERRLTAAAAVFTLVGGTAGLAAAAQDALPGEALYPIKRGIEEAQLSFQSDADDRGRTYLQQAEDRLDEAVRLMEEDSPTPVVAETVDSFVVQAVAGADLLLASFDETGSSEDIELLRTFTAEALPRLQELAESAPADIQDELARAAVVLQRIDQQATASCEQCSDRPALEMPVLMAQAAEISRAMEAVRTQQVNNDHPTLGVKLPAPSRPAPRDRDNSGATDGGQADGPRVGGLPTLGVEGSGALPKSPKEALDGVDKATGGLLGQVTTTTEKTVEDLEKNLEEGIDDTLDSGLGD